MGTKKCQYCKQPIDKAATVCPYCQRKQTSGCLTAALFVTGILVAVGVFGSISAGKKQSTNTPPETPAQAQPQSPTETAAPTEAATEQQFIHYEAELSDGYYTAGIDFPAGKYDISVVDGNGNVSSSNLFDGGINTMMGVSEEYEMYQKEYKNISLPSGESLHVRGNLCVKIASDKASPDPLQPRNQSISETLTLTNGYYVAGEDFPAGVYTITAIEGSGNVSSDNMFDDGLNAIMGVVDDNSRYADLYAKDYKNVDFKEGVTLKINGLTVELTPST